ncbi:MAG: T9SS type A sorting domain-containing protein [Candidatus Coatesbacteria bacterium]|nr:MAG: T9SS type A sorting domain-containing protein [Candidatus Coatesbacteria bacterium]
MKLKVTIIIFFIPAAALAAEQWNVGVVDAAGNVGQHNALALDGNGRAHISYYEYLSSADGNLKYAKWTGSAWAVETVDTRGNVGRYTSVAVDGQGYPRISYYYGSSGFDLKYARWNGSQWLTEAVDTTGNVGLYTSIALDGQGRPHLAYYDATPANRNLKYARWTGSAWDIQTVDATGDVGWWASLALDSQGRAHIAYRDETNSDLKYARWTGSSWDVQTVDSAGNKGEYASLALDSQDRPHIAYCYEYVEYVFTYHDLRYARWTGSTWNLQTVDNPRYLELGEWTSLALDGQDRAHISCYEGGSNRDLKYIKWTGSAWEFVTVDGGPPYVGRYTSIALDSRGNPHISYFDFSTNDLKYAWYGDPGIGIDLISFRASPAGTKAVAVTWEVAERVAGFNLYRERASAAAASEPVKVNAKLITGRSPYRYRDAAVEAGNTYRYWLEVVPLAGAAERFGPVGCTVGGKTPFALAQNRPNPASTSTTVAFSVPGATEAELTVFDVAGRKVAAHTVQAKRGENEVALDVSTLAPGVYTYRLEAGGEAAARKMVVTR